MIALPSLVSETIFHVGSFNVTNTYFTSTCTVVFFLILGLLIRHNITMVPGKLQNFAELFVETMLGYADQVTGSRSKSLKLLPIFGALFLFILASNWIGILPGVGSFGWKVYQNGVYKELVPWFRPANTDLNSTLSMAVLGVVLSHILGIVVIGFWRYLNKFVKLGDIFRALRSKKPINIMTAFIEFGAGLLEIISEFAKMISLSLRLFGNVFAGEVLLTVLGSLIAYLLPLPFMGLELLVGIVQATVFAMLVLVYISVATMPLPEHGHEHGDVGDAASATGRSSGVPDLIAEPLETPSFR